MYKLVTFILFMYMTNAELLLNIGKKGATLKPLSVCCDIPEIGDAKHLETCSYSHRKGPCSDVKCVFEESRFLLDQKTLNKESYKNHLKKWAEDNKGWSIAVEEVIKDCVDKEPRQHLNYSCVAYDVFACTGFALLKKCPPAAWKCGYEIL